MANERLLDLIDRIRKFIQKNRLIACGDRVILSLSAGKDSMFLLHVMLEMRDEFQCRLGVFHLNHMMRGEESDRDEEFVRRVAESNNLPCIVERRDVRATRAPGRSPEEHAREMRYLLLREASEAGGHSRIATAHTRNDQAETILMRILTGTGIHGLRGIPLERDGIIRPLLCVSSGDVYTFLASRDIEWREDRSNADPSFARNFVRNDILPRALGPFPMAIDAAISLGEIAADTLSLLDDMVDRYLPGLMEESDGCIYLDASRIIMDRRLFAHVVSRAIRGRLGLRVNRTMLEQMHDRCAIRRSNVRLYEDADLRVDKIRRGGGEWIRLSKHVAVMDDAPRWEYRLNPSVEGECLEIREIGISVSTRLVDYDFFCGCDKNNMSVFVTLDNAGETIYIRNRREGDRIKTKSGRKKLKDLLIEGKLDGPVKSRVPILTDGAKILAAMPGFVSDASNRVPPDFMVDKNSNRILAVFAIPEEGKYSGALCR